LKMSNLGQLPIDCRYSGYVNQFQYNYRFIGGSKMSILGLALVLIVAALCAHLAQKYVPSAVPGGLITSTIVGVVGAHYGSTWLGSYGPEYFGVSLVSCAVGSAVAVLALSLGYRVLHKKA